MHILVIDRLDATFRGYIKYVGTFLVNSNINNVKFSWYSCLRGMYTCLLDMIQDNYQNCFERYDFFDSYKTQLQNFTIFPTLIWVIGILVALWMPFEISWIWKNLPFLFTLQPTPCFIPAAMQKYFENRMVICIIFSAFRGEEKKKRKMFFFLLLSYAKFESGLAPHLKEMEIDSKRKMISSTSSQLRVSLCLIRVGWVYG